MFWNKLHSIVLLIIFTSIVTFGIIPPQATAQTCNVGETGGLQVDSCGLFGTSGGASGYCGTASSSDHRCTCDAGSCSCTVASKTCNTVSTNICKCWITGESCSGGSCSTSTYSNNVCNCKLFSSCSESAGSATLYCGWSGGPTSVPNPNPTDPPANPTAVPTAVPTPTPQIVGNIYSDPNDGTVFISGNACTKIGTAPVPLALANASIKATKASNGTVVNGTITGSTYRISGGLVTGASDYQVALALPTPAPNSTIGYICGCPTGSDNFLCQYSGIASNGTPNFFVKEASLANAWWQTYGGSVYARDQIQTQIPVATCDAAGTCTSALIVGSGSNTSGFAVLGTNGVLKTTAEGSDAYVQSSGSRTTATGAYAVGVSPGQETYDYFTERLTDTPTNVTSLAELKAAILGQASDSTGLYRYTGGNLLIDKDSASVPLALTNNKRVVVFVPGNITFSNSNGSNSPVLTDVPVGSFLMFVSSGNITVEPSVGYSSASTNPLTNTPNLSGVFVADGQIIIQSDGDTSTADRKFIGGGTFVGWDTAGIGNGLDLQRSFENTTGLGINSTNPAEAFVYRPDFMTSYPTDLKIAHYNWQEIAPQR